MTPRTFVLAAALIALPIGMTGQGQGVPPADLRKPLGDSWLTYSGDYSGRRFSPLTQINQGNVHHLTLAWVASLPAGMGAGSGRAVQIGGYGSGDFPLGNQASVKGTPLMVDGTLYVSAPDHAWAIDARDGNVLWRYFWKTRGGTHIANRGVGLWNNHLYMVTPDNYLVSLDARTGAERWNKVHADFNQQYFSTTAPIVIGNQVLVGTGNDLDSPGYMQSFDAETGEVKWRTYLVPMKAGDPGLETWPHLNAASHGGAHPWLPGAYDPETDLYIFGTGNPTPAYTPGRGEGDNLYTCSLVAVNVTTGKMAWHLQTSPHDTHDWDSAQTPIIFDAMVDGRMRKLVSTAARNGYFFTADRVTGEPVVTSRYGLTTNWGVRIDERGTVRRDPDKDPIIPGALVSPNASGTINWEPPAYNPDTGLFYVSEKNVYSIFYLTDPDPRGSMGLGGHEKVDVGSGGNFLTAIEPTTGRVAWRRPYAGATGLAGGGGGILTTAGNLVFTGDAGNNLVAYDATTGRPLWHTKVGTPTNPPITYMLDGRQHVLVASGGTLFAFVLY